MTCQRRLRRLLRDTRYTSGHLAQVTVYEEAKGELRYNVYLADHAARIQLNVDATLLGRVLPDSDTTMGERQAITSEDASRLLVPITDRLVVSPSRTTLTTMGAGCDAGGKKLSLSSQGFVLKIRCKVRTVVWHRSYSFGDTRKQVSSCIPCHARINTLPHVLHVRVAQGGVWSGPCALSLVHVTLLPHGRSEEEVSCD